MRIFKNVTKNHVVRSMVFGVALLGAGGIVTSAQGQYGPRYDYIQRRDWNQNNRVFQDGYDQGRFDAERNRAYRPQIRGWMTSWERDSYRAGYDRGYRDFQRRGLQFRFNFGR